MKKIFFFASLLFISHSLAQRYGFTSPDGNSQYQPFVADGILHTIAKMPWTADMRGNHRAVVTVGSAASSKAVMVELPWRRPDMRPETKKIIVVDSATGREIKNVQVLELSSEKGSIAFEPITVPGKYFIYYLPYKFRKGWDDARYGKPWNDYLPPAYEADSNWLNAIQTQKNATPKAKVERFESRSRFDFFTPMGLIATKTEVEGFKKSLKNIMIFLEDRAFPIRLTNNLPIRWVKSGPSSSFKGTALRNEYYVWQLGVWAAHQSLKNVKLKFSDLKSSSFRIAAKEITCFNQEGTNWDGGKLNLKINVPQDQIQVLWCGVQIPENAPAGIYHGTATVYATGEAPVDIDIQLQVKPEVLKDKGDGDLWRHARLRWLNSAIGEDDLPVAPYLAMQVKNNTITATDKEVILAGNGLPAQVSINNKNVLASPFRFIVETDAGAVEFAASNLKINKKADGLITWSASSRQNDILFNCTAQMEFDGYIRYTMQVSANRNIEVKDIWLVNSFSPYASEYFMGVGFKGGFRPVSHHWNWQGPYDSYWIGNAKAGLHVEYLGGEYHGPLLNDYKPAPPPSWFNEGKGTISLSGKTGEASNVVAGTGKVTLSAQEKKFEFALIITPVKPVNTANHFSERYYHAKPEGFDKAAEEGANIANIHHAQTLNPYINYPFLVRDSLIDFINHQHENNRKVKLYYTIRELTNYTTEIFALKSLGKEILAAGPGYGIPWHTEHLIEGYKPAWYTELPGETSDAALVLSGFSRWINYYLEGLRWMFENYKIDGIYMDDVSFDRPVMKRMRKIITQYRSGALIDLHSNTGYSVGPANQYTGFFPYIDRLWFGESFKYNEMTPDEWFVTFSGIPFGLMSEMLQDGGNRFLGMVYGTTARHSYGEYDPAPVWRLWEDFGIQDAKMLGYWDEKSPISTNDTLVKATAYVKADSVLIALGNFSNTTKEVKLTVNWKSLGMAPGRVELRVPEVKDFQKAAVYHHNQSFPIKPKEGVLLILSKK